MQIDSRLDEIDDCLYRVAIRVLIIDNDKVLLVKEVSDDWWALPGGGVAHGETVESTLRREVEEELGVPSKEILPDFKIVYYNIGSVVNGVPRMNLFFKASITKDCLNQTDEIVEWAWFTRDEFQKAGLHASFHKTELAEVIFNK